MLRFTTLIAFLLAATTVQATTIHVPSEQATIQAGIDATSEGDTVLVAPGTYVANTDISSSGLGSRSQLLLTDDETDIVDTNTGHSLTVSAIRRDDRAGTQEDHDRGSVGDAFDACCEGRVGDANGLGGDEPTIGDVSHMVYGRFVERMCEDVLACLTEADVNQSGGSNPTCDDITIADIAILLDYVYFTGPSLGLPDCLAGSVPPEVCNPCGADLSNPDSVYFEIIGPDPVSSDSVVVAELYFVNDAQDLTGVSLGFSWDNPLIEMDSVVWSAELTEAFWDWIDVGYHFGYFRDDADSTNLHRLFQCTSFRVAGYGLLASEQPKLVASYYFHFNNFAANHSMCISLDDFIDHRFVDANHNEYIPQWSGSYCTCLENDDDCDGIPSPEDNCPDTRNPNQTDTDGDQLGDACDDDDDGDGIPDTQDNCPLDYNPDQDDNDSDGAGDTCDEDDDNDSVPDDGDGSGDSGDNPCTGGQTEDCDDNCPNTYNANQADSDSDEIGDTCDNCPSDANASQDDTDNDSVGDVCDNCPDGWNPLQEDADNDGLGDVCDGDRDGDGVDNGSDNCPDVYNPNQVDTDEDNVGDACDRCPGHDDGDDIDGDGVPDGCDECLGYDDNADADGDQWPDGCDNCPYDANPDQQDVGDPQGKPDNQIGDACDCCDGRVGDANGLGGDEPTIGDVSTMIDALFIGGDPAMIVCLAEADVNQSGGLYPTPNDITIGDISTLIDYLFITGPSLGLLECL